MSWREELELELSRGKQAADTGNAGKARTCARRAVGIVVSEFQKGGEQKYGTDALRQLQGIAADGGLPSEVREAAGRLQSRIAQDFTSLSEHPLEDALVIIRFFGQKLRL